MASYRFQTLKLMRAQNQMGLLFKFLYNVQDICVFLCYAQIAYNSLFNSRMNYFTIVERGNSMAQEKDALSKIAGSNFAHMLWQRHISQKEFAVIVDRTPRTVRRWMYEGIPTLDDLQTIAEALGVSAMDILSGLEDVHCFYKSGNFMSAFGKVLPYFDSMCYNDW